MECPFPQDGRRRRAVEVWKYLAEMGEGSPNEMAAVMGVTRNTVHVAIRIIRRKYPGSIYIKSWERYTYEMTGRAGGGEMTPVYALGAKRDALKPKTKPRNECDRSRYERRKGVMLTKEIKRRRDAGRAERTPVWLRGLV